MPKTFIYRDTGTAQIVPSYSVMELNKEHLVRYVFRTEKGDIILRHLPWRMKRIIDEARLKIYPNVAELLEKVEDLNPYFIGMPEEDWIPEKVNELQVLYEQLRVTDMYILGVVEEPRLATMEDADALYQSLTETEREQLMVCVQALSSSVQPETVDTVAMEIAQANGLQIIDPLMMELLTVSQANFYMNRIKQENERIRQITGHQVKEVR